jgi:ERF superfamily protein
MGEAMSESPLATALLAFQKDAPTLGLHKSGENPHFRNKFVPLEELVAKVLPKLNEHGLVLTQLPTYVQNEVHLTPTLTTTLIHAESGEKLESSMPLILQREDSQGHGSAITYARRQSLMAILGLAGDEDDDGEAASAGQDAQEAKARPASEAQFKKFYATLGELEKVSPSDPSAGSWKDNVAAWCKERGWSGGVKSLDRDQISQLIDWLDAMLTEAKEAAKVPF